MLSIGPYALKSQVLLAPMAGVTDLPFRNICQEMGAGLTTTEMITSDTTLWKSKKSSHRLRVDKSALVSVQIAGAEPRMMAEAAASAAKLGAQIIDINMGCPAKKVCKKLAGSALLKDEKLVQQILSSVVNSVSIPVTLKTRTGWDHNTKNGVRIAKIAEGEGIKALTVHGRTRACRFEGSAEYDTIAEICSAVTLPVIANGDINSATKAKFVLDYTGAQGIMVGRSAFGNPWIFEQINAYLNAGKPPIPPPESSIVKTVMRHFEELYKFYGDYKGIRIARKHFSWYCRQHLVDCMYAVMDFNQLESTQSQLDAVQSVFQRQNLYEDKVA